MTEDGGPKGLRSIHRKCRNTCVNQSLLRRGRQGETSKVERGEKSVQMDG